MTKNTLKAVLGTMILLGPIVASANLGSMASSTKPRPAEGRMEALKEKMTDLKAKASSTKEKMEERRDNRQEKVDERREALKKIAIKRFESVIKRFEATIERLEMISAKIVSRIEKIKSNGGNTEDAEKYVREAKIHLDEAKDALGKFKDATSTPDLLVDANGATSTPIKTGLKKIRDMAMEVEKHIKEARQDLLKSVRSLRGVSGENHATSTNSN